MREVIFKFAAKFFGNHYKTVLIVVAIIFAIIITYLSIYPPKIESDIMSLLPQKDPVVKDFKSALDDFKSIDHLFVLVKVNNKDGTIEDYFDIVDDYVDNLKKSGLISSVEYRIQDLEPAVKDLLPYLFLYLDADNLDNLKEAFSTESIKSSIAKNRESISRPTSFFEKQLVRLDPLRLLPVLKDNFLGKTRQLKVDLSTGYYLSKGKDYSSLLIIVRPKEPAQDIVFGKKLFKTLKNIEKEVKDNDPESLNLSFSYGGGYAVNQSDSSLVIRDAILNTLSSFILVLLVTFLSFRSRVALVCGWLPLLLALFFTLFIMRLFGGTISSATASIGALLIGLGIDFSTVLYGRFINERKEGETLEKSLERTMVHTFKGVFVGAVTTMATFFSMVITPFNGMRQIGVLVSLGIFLVLLLNFILFPSMITFHYYHKKKKGKEPKLHLNTLRIDKISHFSVKYPVVTIILSAGITVLFGYYALNISLDDSVQALRSPNNKGLAVTREINESFGASFTYMMATFDGSSPFEVVKKGKVITESLKPLKSDGKILFSDSLSTYLPPEDQQRKVIKKLSELRKQGFTYERIERDFKEACKENNFDPNYFKDFLLALKKMLDPEILTYERLSSSPLAPYTDMFIVKKGENKYRGAVYIYISEEYKRNEPYGLAETVKNVCPDATVTGINRLSKTLKHEMKVSSLKTIIIGTIFVFLIVYIDFKSFFISLLSLSPLFISLVWLLGSLTLLKEPLNMMNIFVLTMIIGIGSDYGIHIVHRYRESTRKDFRRIINESVKGVIIATLTTIAGFGSLYASSFPGLKSIGLVALLGTSFSCLNGICFLLAVLSLLSKRKRRK